MNKKREDVITDVMNEAVRLFEGDRDAASLWLNRPAKALGGATPMSCLDTKTGVDEVKDLIGRLEYGVVT